MPGLGSCTTLLDPGESFEILPSRFSSSGLDSQPQPSYEQLVENSRSDAVNSRRESVSSQSVERQELMAGDERQLAARSALCAAVAELSVASSCALSAARRMRLCESLHNALVEAEAAGLEFTEGASELSAADELFSVEMQKVSSQAALLRAVRVPDIGARGDIKSLHAAVLRCEAAGLVDPMLVSAKALLAQLVAQQRAVIDRLIAELDS